MKEQPKGFCLSRLKLGQRLTTTTIDLWWSEIDFMLSIRGSSKKTEKSPWEPKKLLQSLKILESNEVPNIDTISLDNRKGIAKFINRIGIYHYNREQFDAAITCFRRAIEVFPDDVLYAQNIVQSFLDKSDWSGAILQADEYLERYEGNLDIIYDKATALVNLGRNEEALDLLRHYENGSKRDDDEEVLLYLNALVEAGGNEDALVVIDKYLSETGRDQNKLKRWKAQILERLGRNSEAEALFKEIGESTAWNVDALDDLISHYETSGNYREAIIWIERKVEKTGEIFETLMVLGRNQLGLGEYRNAKLSFQSALDKRPRSSDAAEYLQYVNSLLGEGDNYSVRKPIDPVSPSSRAACGGSETKEFCSHSARRYLPPLLE